MRKLSRCGMLFFTGLAAAGMSTAAYAVDPTITFDGVTITATSTATAKRGLQTNTRTVTKTATAATLPKKAIEATSAPTVFIKRNGDTQIAVTAGLTGTATFKSAAEGSFVATTATQIVQSVDSTPAIPLSGEASVDAYAFKYSFTTADADGMLRLKYILSDPASLGGNSVIAEVIDPLSTVSNLLVFNSSGVVSQRLKPGSYILNISAPFENVISRAGTTIGTTAGSGLDQFSFTFGAVPEPATWAFMILGFGSVGAAMRRSNQRRAMAVV